MTFCLGIKVKNGVLGIADTRITSGNEVITAKKVTIHRVGDRSFFLMTSGLRSVRDKALIYFEEVLETKPEEGFDRLFKAVNAFADQIRRVDKEDGEALKGASLNFNIHALIGGQLSKDKEHKLFLLYPQGNWVEIGQGTPYSIIGATGYGKPVMDRTLKYEDSVLHALKVGCLAFDSTRISASDVDFPIDVVLYKAGQGEIVQHRYGAEELAPMFTWWQERLRTAVQELPSEWTSGLVAKINDRGPVVVQSG